MANPKKYSDGTINHEQALADVRGMFLHMGHNINETRVEAGIDAYLELRDRKTKASLQRHIGVQVKTEKTFKAESDEEFSFYPDPSDIMYWRESNVPVLLVVCNPRKKLFYAKFIDEYYLNSDDEKKRIRFSKESDRFDIDLEESWTRRLLKATDSSHSSLAAPLIEKPEILSTNLLETTPPEFLYRAPAKLGTTRAVEDAFRERNLPIVEFTVHGGSVLSPLNLRDSMAWSDVCETSVVERDSFSEIASSCDLATRNQLVELLTRCLRAKLAVEGFRWNFKDRSLVYFPPIQNQRERIRTPIQRGKKKASLKGLFFDKGNFRRHVSMRPEWVYQDDRFYLVVSPTYYFTNKQNRYHKRSTEFLQKIKQMEKNKEFRSNLELWKSILTKRSELFDTPYQHVSFLEFLQLEMPVGIPDAEWRESPGQPGQSSNSASESNLSFDFL